MSKVIKAMFVAVMLLGLPHASMAAEDSTNNLATLELIRAETTLTEAKIALLEKTQKLKELQSGKTSTPNAPNALAPPNITDFQSMPSPYGTMPPPSNMISAMEGETSTKTIVEDRDEVLGVVGVNGKYTATVRTRAGIYTVGKGDKISGGVVATISLDKVVLKKGGKSVTLPFADEQS